MRSRTLPPLPPLNLSLQFGRFDGVQTHRLVLPRHWVQRVLRHALQSPGELTVRIVDAQEGQALNHSFRKKNNATNVLTFDYERQPVVVADLVLCAPVIEREASEQGKALKNHYAHLLVHGCLHAQGWDHETSEADALEMEAFEVEILAQLGVPNPY